MKNISFLYYIFIISGFGDGSIKSITKIYNNFFQNNAREDKLTTVTFTITLTMIIVKI